jgi:hypothetical protein
LKSQNFTPAIFLKNKGLGLNRKVFTKAGKYGGL